MRLASVAVKNTPPVTYFSAQDRSDVVVVAGPNGVGKTRLLQRIVQHLRGASPNPEIGGVIEATSPDEIAAWGKRELDMSSNDDMALLRGTLQANRLRRKWRSSLLNIDSDRSIQDVGQLAFSFDMPDPDEEQISWDATFGRMRDRFQETVHAMFRMIEAQKRGIANRAVALKKQGSATMNLDFADPMEPFRTVFSLLLAPKELAELQPANQRLEYLLDGRTLQFSTLSSGEREVVNITFDFLLRNPQDCIVFFDEPELHLHPELSYKLIQTLQQIGARNQFIFSTHSPDIITSSLDQSVIFLSPVRPASEEETFNQAIRVTENDETNQALRMIGQSIGIVALGKRIVLIEGAQSSIDKQTYGSIIRNRFPGLVLVPSGGKHLLESFSTIHDAILSRSIWGVDFFMLCDGDSAPVRVTADPTEKMSAQNPRLRFLSRYHLENYFLDEEVWAECFREMDPADSWLRSPGAIRAVFREEARKLVSYSTAVAVASHLRMQFGNLELMPKDCYGKTLSEVDALLQDAARKELERFSANMSGSEISRLAKEYFDMLSNYLGADDDRWKYLIPGKPLLNSFASRARMVPASRAKTLYLTKAAESARQPFSEIVGIFESFNIA